MPFHFAAGIISPARWSLSALPPSGEGQDEKLNPVWPALLSLLGLVGVFVAFFIAPRSCGQVGKKSMPNFAGIEVAKMGVVRWQKWGDAAWYLWYLRRGGLG